MTLFATSRRGRPRKQGAPRDAQGRIAWGHDRERPEDVKRTVLEARYRHQNGVTQWQIAKAKAEKNARAYQEALKAMDDAYRGYALGKLVIVGRLDDAAGITEEQHEAGVWFANILKHMAAKVWDSQSMTPKSIAADMVTGGISHHPEDSPEWIEDLKQRFRDVQAYVYRADRDPEPADARLPRHLVGLDGDALEDHRAPVFRARRADASVCRIRSCSC